MEKKPYSEEDSMIETVEDWNDEDIERQRELEALTESDSLEEMPEEVLEELAGLMSETEEDRDAAVEITVDKDKMEACLYIEAPRGNGAEITLEDVLDALNQQHIVYGVDKDKIAKIVEDKAYRQTFTIAKGKPTVDGVNGKIRDHFPRERQLKFAKKANGVIDFKNMNLIHNVKKGDVICEIIMPEEGEDGIDVFGNTVLGRRGKMPSIPQGTGVSFSQDKTTLVASIEGNLTFRQGRFCVENVFEVGGNVDNSVGNINFSGSVNIHGDVFEGYTVKAKGDITVSGIVEGAHLSAGGNILLQKGMRGMKSGILEAGGNVTGQFLEDCTIFAKGNVEAEYIINSTVSCEKDVNLVGKRGAFIGGRCAVYNTMKVKAVGASSHVATQIILGVTPELLKRLDETVARLGEERKKLDQCRKNMEYLAQKEKKSPLSPIQSKKYGEMKIQYPINQLLIRKMENEIKEMKLQVQGAGKSRLYAQEVHPGTTIQIGNSVLQIRQRESNCMFYYLDGMIKRGIY